MRASTVLLLAWVVGLGLAGCDSDHASTPAPSASGAAPVATCTLAPAPGDGATPWGGTVPGRLHGQVGVVLAAATSDGRPAGVGARLLTRALGGLGLAAEVVVDPQQGPAAFAGSARRLVSRGVQVLILDAADDRAAAKAVEVARRADVPVVDFDRLHPEDGASYLVSFDAEEVGRLQAQAMLGCLADRGVKDPRIIMLDGDTDTDDNAVLRAKGVHEVLDPVVAAGDAQIVAEAAVTGPDVDSPGRVFRRALQAAGGKVDAVVAGDDSDGQVVRRVVRASGLQAPVVVVGQGTGFLGASSVVGGRLSATVFQDARQQAEGAARLAAALVSGKDPTTFGLSLVPMPGQVPGSTADQALLLPGTVVAGDGVAELVRSGAVSVDRLCHGVLAQCAAQGLP